jgi:hypothetical protein
MGSIPIAVMLFGRVRHWRLRAIKLSPAPVALCSGAVKNNLVCSCKAGDDLVAERSVAGQTEDIVSNAGSIPAGSRLHSNRWNE